MLPPAAPRLLDEGGQLVQPLPTILLQLIHLARNRHTHRGTVRVFWMRVASSSSRSRRYSSSSYTWPGTDTQRYSQSRLDEGGQLVQPLPTVLLQLIHLVRNRQGAPTTQLYISKQSMSISIEHEHEQSTRKKSERTRAFCSADFPLSARLWRLTVSGLRMNSLVRPKAYSAMEMGRSRSR